MREPLKLGIVIGATAVLTHAFSGGATINVPLKITCDNGQISNALVSNGPNGSVSLLWRTIAGVPSSYNGQAQFTSCFITQMDDSLVTPVSTVPSAVTQAASINVDTTSPFWTPTP